ncbi:DUF5778 family protein [Halomarina oriensis]|uniref:Uncharacterized protein n=1 Tax=Halomarina oriensis TaxID=671145 RepID=A0A6B0GQU4_9EURY|nr:DUF5778 family protein [Halomarina oriensis]MWG35033.1 hypothetical protein [Halomarina oriensis]
METVDKDLYERTKALLEPGDIRLNGVVVHTGLGDDDEARLHQATLDIGDVVAEESSKGEWYVYSGNDDSRFGLNQHQGLTIAEDEFVWECQQLLREGTFKIVFYYEADADQEAVVAGIEDLGFRADSVEGE